LLKSAAIPFFLILLGYVVIADENFTVKCMNSLAPGQVIKNASCLRKKFMVIVDEKGHILKALEAADLLETEGFEDVKVLKVSEFLGLPLKAHQDLVIVDIPSVLQYPESAESLRGQINTFSGVIYTHPEKETQMRTWAQTEASIFPHVLQVFAWPLGDLDLELFKNTAKTFAWSD
jgi:hypothetical protein